MRGEALLYKTRVLAAVLLAVTVTTLTSCVTVPPSGGASTKNPVVLVHGYVEGNIIWGTFQNSLKAAGYSTGDITNFAYDSTGFGDASSAQKAAGQLATAVDAALAHARANGNPNATKVDLVSHSFGSMVSRWCLAFAGCAGKVDHWMSLAGADNGTWIAMLPAVMGQGSGWNMTPQSQVIQRLQTDQAINAIKSQGVNIKVQWTESDGIIIPAPLSQWPRGDQNPDPSINRKVTVAGVNHLNIFNNENTVAYTINFLRS
jgi:triacylglycerol lipase